MEWLKTILNQAQITDGKLNAQALTQAISAEMAKHTVPKDTYEDIKGKLDTANNQLQKYGDVDIEQLQNDLQTERDGRVKDRQEFILKNTFSGAGAKDVDYLMYKLGESAKFNENNELENKDELLSQAKEEFKSMFEESTTTIQGAKPADGAGNNTGERTYQARLQQAQKENNTLEMIKIKQEAAEEGVFLS